jgi:hypothetical protein
MGSVAMSAHPGGLAGDGCHNDRQNGGSTVIAAQMPAHRLLRGLEQAEARPELLRHPSGWCRARAKGDPGYGTHLDRDGDGIGCE